MTRVKMGSKMKMKTKEKKEEVEEVVQLTASGLRIHRGIRPSLATRNGSLVAELQSSLNLGILLLQPSLLQPTLLQP